MPAFCPVYQITPEIVQDLLRIEAARTRLQLAALSKKALQTEKAKARRLRKTYFELLEETSPNQKELSCYLTALKQVKKWARARSAISEYMIKLVHALLFGKETPSAYRRGQNAVFDSDMKHILYLPPKATDVPMLMKRLITWINASQELPCPLLAAIVHFEINAIHPYYDGNGRTARLLTELILLQGDYALEGLACLEEYYAKDLLAYYTALSISNGKNYYKTRAKADITSWIAYFCKGMADVFEKII